jgi:hypothetical protein
MGDHIDPMRIRLEKIKYQKEKRRNEKEMKIRKVKDAQNMMNQSNWVAGEIIKTSYQATTSTT